MIVDVEKGLHLSVGQVIEHCLQLVNILISGGDNGVPGVVGLLFYVLPVRTEQPYHRFLSNLLFEALVDLENWRHVVAVQKYMVKVAGGEKIEVWSLQVVGVSGLDEILVALGEPPGEAAKAVNEFPQTAHFYGFRR